MTTTLPAGWKPIESAPKDGSLILLGCPDEGPDGRPALSLPGYWIKGWCDAPDDMGQDDGWVDVQHTDFYPGRSFGNPDYMRKGSQPTHWMPLPAAPGSPTSVAPGDAQTPGATWRAKGEADPHGDRYKCERAALTMGDLTDDELANGAFMNYDRPLDIEALMQRRPGYHSPIAWMTAVKDRIRWLSRKLEEAQGAPAAGDAREVDPLQGAANWLVQAHSQPCPTVLSACLMIGYNRAQRLYDAALAAQVPHKGEAA